MSRRHRNRSKPKRDSQNDSLSNLSVRSSGQVRDYILNLPDDIADHLKFHYSNPIRQTDEDGFPLYKSALKKEEPARSRAELQEECWRLFHQNPQINTAIRGLVGRLTGLGFETTSENHTIQTVIEETENDPRNRLHHFWTMYVSRLLIEGELFLLATCHLNGFVEIDFIDPASIHHQGDENSGILFHPRKQTLPLFYNVETVQTATVGEIRKTEQIPSVNIARYPDLIEAARTHKDFNEEWQKSSKDERFANLGGYFRFVIAWNRGLVTRRSTAYLRTTIEWLNHYELLKRYEIDHKKSCGAYAWIYKIEDGKSWKIWQSLSQEEKERSGITQPIAPGQRIVVPPGVDLKVGNPNLPSISGSDTDILDMVTSGLNEPQDVTTGRSSGTFASIKATRGPMSDRVADEVAYFERFLRHDFWGSIFFLKSKISGFPSLFVRREAVEFTKGPDGKPVAIWKDVTRKPESLIDINFPTSEVQDFEAACRGVMGVKHGPVTETLGVPYSVAARKIGLGGYGRMRLRYETEKAHYPDLIYALDAESLQEKVEAEPALQNTEQETVNNA